MSVSKPLLPVLLKLSTEEARLQGSASSAYFRMLLEAHRALDDGDVPRENRRVWIVPGRIEVLGKHVDYAGGRSLLCAVGRGIVLVARARNDRTLIVRDARRREALSLPFGLEPQGSLPWAVYPRTVVHRLLRNFGDALRGADVAIASNLPPAAGVSSSSALVVGLTIAMSSLSHLSALPQWITGIPDRTAFAGYVGALENGADFGILTGERGVGTMGGAQDQTAILCCAADQLDVYAWAPVRHERSVPWPREYVFAIGVSGIVAAKTGGARERYNRVARIAHHLVASWNAVAGMNARTLAQAFAQSADGEHLDEVPEPLLLAAQLGANDEFSEAQLEERLRQFHTEAYQLVHQAADALDRRDFAAFGTVVARSQAGAERALANQIPETMYLAEQARVFGAVASSAFGAGFGGSVWAMVHVDEVERFLARWRQQYVQAFPAAAYRAQFFSTVPSAPAFEMLE